jgi:hypothetical protein
MSTLPCLIARFDDAVRSGRCLSNAAPLPAAFLSAAVAGGS